MALWSDILQEGSYDGVRFDFVRSSVEGGNALDKQEFPNQDGQSIQGRARNARRFSVLGIFIEDDYPDTLNDLIDVLENGGVPREFVDPVFGSMMASCERFTVLHDVEDAADSATITIDFVEHTDSSKRLKAADTFALVGIDDAQGPTAADNTTPARANAVRSAVTDVLVALSAFQEATEVQNNAYVLQVQGAMNAASSIADSLETTGDELSAPAVQQQVNATLVTIEVAVAAGADYDSQEAYELGAAVLLMSSSVSVMAQELIEAKPPLQIYTVRADTNLLAFAHDLYGDSSRADEVLALNSIPDPSMILAGTKLQVYGA